MSSNNPVDHMDIVYSLVKDGRDYGQITKRQWHQGKLYPQVVPPLIDHIAEANMLAASLFHAIRVDGYMSNDEMQQEAIKLLSSLGKAISIFED